MAANDTKSKKKKGAGMVFYSFAFFIALVLLVTILGGIFYFIVRYNINGITDRHSSILAEIPVIGNAVPEEQDDDEENIQYLSSYEVRQRYKKLREDYEKLRESYNTSQENLQKIKEANAGYLDRIEEYEKKEQELADSIKQFNEQKKKFESVVAMQDTDAYQDFYEKMNPETAKQVYSEIVKADEISKKEKEFADYYSGMEPDSAAKILSELGSSNMDKIVAILSNMDKKKASLILEEMDAGLASDITLKLFEIYFMEE